MQLRLSRKTFAAALVTISGYFVISIGMYVGIAHAKTEKSVKKSANKVQVSKQSVKEAKAQSQFSTKSNSASQSQSTARADKKGRVVISAKAAKGGKSDKSDKAYGQLQANAKKAGSTQKKMAWSQNRASKASVVLKAKNPVRSAVAQAASRYSIQESRVEAQDLYSTNESSQELRFAPVSYAPAPRASTRQAMRSADSILGLRAVSAYVVDQDTGQVLLSKNPERVMPIASITKLVTALVVREARQPLDEYIELTIEDAISLRGTRSRLRVGDVLSRGDLMHIMLMSSENMAAHALARSFPGGFDSFLYAVRDKIRTLGMMDSSFEDASGLSHLNRSSAKDLATLMRFAYVDPVIRMYTTSPSKQIFTGTRILEYSNTNALVRSSGWEIGLQKTGYISAAGSCLVMQATVGGRKILMVFLDAPNKSARISNAEKVLEWVSNGMPDEEPTLDVPLASSSQWGLSNQH